MPVVQYLFVDHVDALVTFVVGLIGLSALWLYRRQRLDKKREIARIILTEIRSAEASIEVTKSLLDRGAKDFPKILTTNTWSQHGYMFATDFDQDQLREIGEFYKLCENMQLLTSKDNDFFWTSAEHRAKVYQDKLVELYDRCYDDNIKMVDFAKFEELRKGMLEIFASSEWQYIPAKTVNHLKTAVAENHKLTTTTTGSKLKLLAGESG